MLCCHCLSVCLSVCLFHVWCCVVLSARWAVAVQSWWASSSVGCRWNGRHIEVAVVVDRHTAESRRHTGHWHSRQPAASTIQLDSSLSLPACLSPLSFSVCLSAYPLLFVCLPACPSVFFCLSLCLSPSICLYLCLPILLTLSVCVH